jgi:uncharacterized Zn-binding protein involved in type VI secretion
MYGPAAKQNDTINSDGSSMVWVQPPGSPPPTPVTTPFAYSGPITGNLSSNVFVNNQPAATVDSTATNSTPPASQPAVTGVGAVLSVVNNTATIITGSSRVWINGKMAARNGDTANTWDYSTPPTPGTGMQIPNGTVAASSTVFIGD